MRVGLYYKARSICLSKVEAKAGKQEQQLQDMAKLEVVNKALANETDKDQSRRCPRA